MDKEALHTVLLAAALSVCLAAPAWSSGLMDSIRNQAEKNLGGGAPASQPASGLGGVLGGAGGSGSALGLPGISSDTAGNAAGVLQYCIKNKYLGGTNASSVKDNLLGKLGLASAGKQRQDAGYQQGLGGVLSGGNGSSFDLNKVKSGLKEKACDYVLNNASSLL